MSDYGFAPEACDVVRKDRLILYRAKRSEWLRLLDEDPIHSISQQLSAMQWNDVVYRCFNEARRLAPRQTPTAAVAPILGEFLDVGYLSTQVLAISKLVERNASKPQKTIISIRRLVDDLIDHRSLLTREIFVCNDGLPYDPMPARERFYSALMSTPGPKVGWASTTGPEAWGITQRMHALFDRLSGVAAADRSRDDLIQVTVFDALSAGLDDPSIKGLLQLRHKLIAHAADAENRPDNLVHASLNQIEAAQRILVKIAHTVGGTILYGNGAGGLPTPQFDQFEHLDQPFVRPTDVEKLRTYWNEQSGVRDKWLQHADAEIIEGKRPT
ncbi:hypothetical protein IVA96_23800 [Bradyrhizobium sp. 159]|uniref:hypothetical protein n=1 Tax=Bradyrhizobium sp. 159 TaxID=2782632 RepID=UPI001FF7CF31|nr:hypothetical protein [Bradyrhizobium sp. 159]MCK1619543.1 hypothetical protein [Bradyrhizobium sp. 159]